MEQDGRLLQPCPGRGPGVSGVPHRPGDRPGLGSAGSRTGLCPTGLGCTGPCYQHRGHWSAVGGVGGPGVRCWLFMGFGRLVPVCF